MASQLRTVPVIIGKEGPTKDGRTIKRHWLEEMSASYDPVNKHAALISWEHCPLQYMRNFGEVISLSTKEGSDGMLRLYAVLSPTADLLDINQRGQKLFTSMEVIENYAKTGQAYLAGIAVTDDPASQGTTRLRFSAQQDFGAVQCFNQQTPWPDLFSDQNKKTPSAESANEDQIKHGFLAAFADFFGMVRPGANAATNQTVNTDASEEDTDAMNTEQFEALNSTLTTLGTAVATLNTKLSAAPVGDGKAEGDDGQTEGKAPGAPEKKDASTVSEEQFKTLTDTVEKLNTTITELASRASGSTNAGEAAGGDDFGDVA